jgi:hypothetical protein
MLLTFGFWWMTHNPEAETISRPASHTIRDVHTQSAPSARATKSLTVAHPPLKLVARPMEIKLEQGERDGQHPGNARQQPE